MNREEAAKAKFIQANKAKIKQIGIGIPSNDEWKANFGMAYAAMSFYCGLANIPIAFFNQKGSILPKNRNNLVRDAIKHNCSHLLQMDCDLTFPPYALARLLSHQKPIVGCTYARRSQPHDNLAIPLNKQPVQNATGLTAVDRLPTGMLLIAMEVFEKIPQPWFRFPTIEATEANPSGSIDGEDYHLCDAARIAGYDVLLDVELSFEITHWGEAGWRLKDGIELEKRYEMVELESSLGG